MYVLAVAGFDTAHGGFVRHGYSVFADVGRGPGPLPPGTLRRANGDLEALQRAGRFPEGFSGRQGFDGDLARVRWRWQTSPTELHVPLTCPAETCTAPTGQIRMALFVPWITKGRGGTENVGQMVANAMAARGHHVDLFTFDDDRAPSRWPLHEEIGLRWLPEEDTREAHQQAVTMTACGRYDVIIGLHMNRQMLRYAKLATQLDLPLVLSEHGEPRALFIRGTTTPEEREIAFAHADVIHLTNNRLRDALPDYLKRRVTIIPNAVPDCRKLSAPDAEDDRKMLLSVGRLVQGKNYQTLIKAFAAIADRTPDWTLRIAGDGPDAPRLHELAQPLGGQIEFLGHRDDIYPLYENAHLFALASVSEVFGLATLEAMAHGLPVVAAQASVGARRLVTHERTGRLAEGSNLAQSLSKHLLELMRDPGQRADLGAAARQVFLEEFREEIVMDRWEKMIYSVVLAPHHKSRCTRESYCRARLLEAMRGDAHFNNQETQDSIDED